MSNPGGCLYKDPNAPVEVRVKDLLSRMTLQEKLAQMIQLDRVVADAHYLRDLAVERLTDLSLVLGSVLSTGGSAPFENALTSDWADMVDGFQKLALESRLGIPIIYGVDAVHGNNCVYGATVFPHNVGLGATRDADLVKRIGAATALEVRASGIQYTFAPCVAVCKDPRWGRCYESYSEDTDIVRKMTSIITGLQGEPPEGHPHGYPFVAGSDRNNVVACAKHFVGDGGTHKGLNEGNTICSYEDLERIHMAPYLDCISQGVATIMASYSSWNGRKLHTDRFLLIEVLKDKLGFKGFVISDWEGLNRLSQPRGSNYRHCVASAINAGIDMVMVGRKYEQFVDDILSLAKSGEISTARIDDAVERILRVKFIAGLFEHPFADRSLLEIVGCKLHRDLAQEAVRKSLVLLKNGKDPNKPLLPLDKKARKILVAGTHAANHGYQCGGWTIAWYGLGGRITIGTTILDAVRKAVGENTEVVFEEYPSAETLARKDFSYAIVAIGEPPYAEFTGDDPELVIQIEGRDIVSLVADRIPTLAILVSGRPLVLEPHLLEKIEAVVAAWLPGTEGDGIADVIFGGEDFKGQLPVTWFKKVDQLPMKFDGGINNVYDPLFPLGFGLTYK
ncbi:Beta-glucosidase BoGH3B [Linum grandiflorum]